MLGLITNPDQGDMVWCINENNEIINGEVVSVKFKSNPNGGIGTYYFEVRVIDSHVDDSNLEFDMGDTFLLLELATLEQESRQ